MYDEVVGGPRRPLGVGGAPLFRLGMGELLRRSARLPRFARGVLAAVWSGERRGVADLALSIFELLPAGLLDNSGVRDLLARLFAMPGRTDSFAALRRELYIVAVDLDRGTAVAFGEKGRRQAPISQTVQASTALPGLYRPVRIAGRDYVGRRREEDGPRQPGHPARRRLGHLHQSPGPHPERGCERPAARAVERQGGDVRPGPGPAAHAARPHAVRDGALQGRASRGRHPARGAGRPRPADVLVQHHALQRPPRTGGARLPLRAGHVREAPPRLCPGPRPARHRPARRAAGAPARATAPRSAVARSLAAELDRLGSLLGDTAR
jgi:hypothetical protein